MKIKDIVAIVAVALAAGGCSQQDDGTQQDERVPILLKASVDVEAVGQTRVAGDWGERTTTMTQGSEFLVGEHVIAYIKENDGTNTANIKWPIEYAVVNGNGDLDPVSDAPFYYPVGVNTINIHAIHPSYTSGAGFTVETDQTTEANYAKSDLCYSKPRDYTRSGTTSYLDANGRRVLQFKHLLSKIIVNLTVNASAVTGTPDYIILHAKTTTAMAFPANNDNGYTGCMSSDASNPGVIKMIQEAIIPPQEIAAGASFISLTVPGIGPMMYPMPTATTFESGKKYTYNLKVTDVGITATTNVTDWGEKVANQQVMGRASLASNDYTKNPLYYVSEYNWNPSGGDFFNTHDNNDVKTVATWTWAYNNRASGALKASYHVPTEAEWAGIIPNGNAGASSIDMLDTSQAWYESVSNPTATGAVEWAFTVAGTTITSGTTQSVFRQGDDGWYYAIRFIKSGGCPYCSAWRYKWDSTTGICGLIVESFVFATPVEEIKEGMVQELITLWPSEGSRPGSYCSKFFPAAGAHDYLDSSHAAAMVSTSNNYVGEFAAYWSCSPDHIYGNTFAEGFCAGNTNMYLYFGNGRGHARSIRLFKDAE